MFQRTTPLTATPLLLALVAVAPVRGTLGQNPGGEGRGGARSAEAIAADFETVRALQARRVEVMDRVAPSVCSVMAMDSPGGGSGVIFDPLGFVLTNYHVVGKPKGPGKPEGKPDGEEEGEAAEDESVGSGGYATMKIGLPDGRLYKGEVLGIDPGSDLAVIWLGPREDGEPWPYTPLGNSDDLLVGEPVFAMGNPFLLATDFTPTVTWGVVSGTHRYQSGQGDRMLVYPDCIQVDAPVNPGNSGGPLFNEQGEVVGINGRIQLRDRGRVNTGVGFAIASQQIRNFLADMMAGRHTEHGTLDLNAYFMNSRAEDRRGVYVQAIFGDSQARALGVDLGDELVRFNGREVRSANQLATMVGVLPEGAWVSLDYRPVLEDGFGPVESVMLQMTRLDTGSSGRQDWLASEEVRRAARVALSRNVAAYRDAAIAAENADVRFATVTTTRHGHQPVVRYRRGEMLRIEGLIADGDSAAITLVRTAPGEGFAIEDGVAVDLNAEQKAHLEREYACNPLLLSPSERATGLTDSTLHGGVFVHGQPAAAFVLPGDADPRVYYYEGGAPAGWVYRDPIAKERLEYRIPHPSVVAAAEHARGADPSVTVPGLRVLREAGTMELGGVCTVDVATEVPAALFKRPGQ